MEARVVLCSAIRNKMGFLTDHEVAVLAADPSERLGVLLVRCHQGRFMAPAQDVPGLIAAVEAGGWSVRDVSLHPQHSAWRSYGLLAQQGA